MVVDRVVVLKQETSSTGRWVFNPGIEGRMDILDGTFIEAVGPSKSGE